MTATRRANPTYYGGDLRRDLLDTALELIARLLAGHEVADLTLEEPDIEDIVRRIYRGEPPPGGLRPSPPV